MKELKALSLLGLGSFGIALGLAATAYGSPTFTAGTQAALPLAVAGLAAYTTPITFAPAPGNNAMLEVALCRDDGGPCVRVHFATTLGFSAPFGAAGSYDITYRPDCDPCQLQIPGGGGGVPAPATTTDMSAEWQACVAVDNAFVTARPNFAAPAGGVTPLISVWVDPATVSLAFYSTGIGTNEFYKFDIQH